MITSDSTTDLSPELRERYNVAISPLGITLGDKVYTDGVDITPDDIYAHHAKTGELPKTAATNVGDCLEFFKKFKDENKTVIHFTISSDMSSTYNNACIAAEELGNVYVIDTKNLSTGGGLLVVAAAEMLRNGLSAEEIVEKTKALEYLYKGGRCSALAMFGANLLKLKPCIQVKNGKMDVSKKYRGKYGDVLKQYITEKVSDHSDIILDRVFITHAGCDPELVKEVTELAKSLAPFKEVFVTRAGCTVSSHCGANTLGILFIRKSPI